LADLVYKWEQSFDAVSALRLTSVTVVAVNFKADQMAIPDDPFHTEMVVLITARILTRVSAD
jgi:hypothetical protein